MTSSNDNIPAVGQGTAAPEDSSLVVAESTTSNTRHSGERKTFLQKYSTTILCLTLFLLPLIVVGSLKSLKVYANDVRQWLPSGFEEAVTYDKFVTRFGIDEMVVLSWEDCKLNNPEVIQLQRSLQNLEIDGKEVFSRVVSGPDMLTQIESIGVSPATARERVEGLLVGKDGETTCIIAYPAKQFFSNRRTIIERVYELAEAELGLSAEMLKLGGPTLDGAAIETESKKSLGTYLWMSVALVFLITWYRMRDLPLSILVILFSGLCASLSLTILYWTGGQMNLTMVMLPTLTFILGVSGCVHMVNYYRKAATAGHGIRSADQAIIDGGYPIALSATTTAIGLMSLASSHVNPIRLFGFYSGCGIMASVAVMLLVLPASLYLLRGRISKRFSSEGSMSKRERKTGVSRSTSMLLTWVYRSHWLVVIPALIGVTLLAVGVMWLSASVKIQNRFSERTKVISDYTWMESNLGPLVPMEVVLHFTADNELNLWQKMLMVKSIEKAVKQTTAVNATLSVATFEPYIPRGSRFIEKFERKARLEKWKSEFNKFEEAKLVSKTDDESFWRISLRVAALNDIDYGGFLETVGNNVQNQIQHINQPGVKAYLTGGIPLVYKAQHQILRDLSYSFLTAFLLITVILICVLRSFWAGLVAMIPNVFPPLVVFGAMGWLGTLMPAGAIFSIEIGSVMTASVALGIAVDDTLHFLTWYRRGTKEGLSRFSSIRYAFDHCAKAMIDTSLICGLGVLPFVFGVFVPTIKFALLLMIMLFTALLGDLILLPAILAGPAGNLFRLKRKHAVGSNQPPSKDLTDESPNSRSHDSDLDDLDQIKQKHNERIRENERERHDQPETKSVSNPSNPFPGPVNDPINTIRRT